MNIIGMTDAQKNELIALECGWHHELATQERPVERDGMRLPCHFRGVIMCWWHKDIPGVYAWPPDYLKSKDHIQKAQAYIPAACHWSYGKAIREIRNCGWPGVPFAEAHECADAFLIVLPHSGAWKK